MSPFRVCLFGKFSAECDGRHLSSLHAGKVLELFCYLLLHRDQPHPREILASLLWGDTNTAQSRRYLRQALWQLNATLDGQNGTDHGRLVLAESEWVLLNPQAEVWLDVAVLENALVCAKGVPDRNLHDTEMGLLREAAQLYQGDLLAGWYQEWCLAERQRLRGVYLAIMGKLMGASEAQGDYENAVDYGRCILRYDRARECTHRKLMRLYCLLDDPAQALRQYEECSMSLQEELAVKPSASTRALYEQIRQGSVDRSAHRRQVLDRLRAMEEELKHIQQELRHEIGFLESYTFEWCADPSESEGIPAPQVLLDPKTPARRSETPAQTPPCYDGQNRKAVS